MIVRNPETNPPRGDLSRSLVNAMVDKMLRFRRNVNRARSAARDRWPRGRGRGHAWSRPQLQPDRTIQNARKVRWGEFAIGARRRVPEEQRIRHQPRIESLAGQLLLLLLEGFGGVERGAKSDNDRVGIDRQPARQMICELGKIKTLIDHDRGHSGAAVGAGNSDAIGGGMDDARAVRNRLVHFRRRDILAFPAEGVADPVDKVEEAGGVELHQVAGAKPGIALRENIAQHFLLGLLGIGITLEAAAALVGDADAADGFTGFAADASHAEAVFAANRRAGIHVDADDRGWKAMRQQRRNPADRARLALDIVEREIALGCGIEFEDLRNRKACLKRLPDIAAQAVW